MNKDEIKGVEAAIGEVRRMQGKIRENCGDESARNFEIAGDVIVQGLEGLIKDDKSEHYKQDLEENLLEKDGAKNNL